MEKTKIVLVGFGYRARYFYRIAKYIDSEFEISAIVIRNKDKVSEVFEETNIFTTVDLEEALSIDHDYVVLSVSKNNITGMLEVLFEKGEKVLCETPPATNVEELERLYELYKKYDAKIQVAEQYPFWAIYSSYKKIIEIGYIGEPQMLKLSKAHGYHGAALIREFFNSGFKNVAITGKSFELYVIRTSERSGLYFDGQQKKITREVLTMEYEDGKVCLWDFTPELYFSHFLSQNIEITGYKGQIVDTTVKYLNDEFVPVCENIVRYDRGVYQNREWSHQNMTVGNVELYRTPFPNARLNDDELAIATCMRKMKDYVDSGTEFCKFEYSLQDTYVSILMNEALENPFKTVKSKEMIWAKNQ